MKLTQSFLIKWIPNVNHTIRSASCERIVAIVKSNGVHWIYELDAFLFVFAAVTLKGILLFLHLGIHVEVLDGHTALDRTQHKALFVRKTSNTTRLKFERGFARFRRAHIVQIPNAYFAHICANN